jgi:hypothetical protein
MQVSAPRGVNGRGGGQVEIDALWRGFRYHTQAVCAIAGAAAFSFIAVFMTLSEADTRSNKTSKRYDNGDLDSGRDIFLSRHRGSGS